MSGAGKKQRQRSPARLGPTWTSPTANRLRSWGFLTNPSRTFKGGPAAQRSRVYTWVRNVCGRDERVGPLIIDLSRRGKEMQGYVSRSATYCPAWCRSSLYRPTQSKAGSRDFTDIVCCVTKRSAVLSACNCQGEGLKRRL